MDHDQKLGTTHKLDIIYKEKRIITSMGNNPFLIHYVFESRLLGHFIIPIQSVSFVHFHYSHPLRVIHILQLFQMLSMKFRF